MYFGIEKEKIENLGATYTAKEIYQQPQSLLNAYEIIKNQSDSIKEFLHKNLKENTRIILTGAGTSAYVGDTIYLYLAKELRLRVESIATTDLVSNPDLYLEENTPTILVSFARSGNSPESVGAYDLCNKLVKDIKQVVITCNEEGELAKKASKDEGSFCLLMPEETNDKSFAMTSSFSSMMLSAILFFDIENIEQNKKYVDIVVKQGQDILDNSWKDIKELVQYNCKRVVYLGSGYFKGLAREMALKNLELTSGKVVSVCESVLGFRHGPKSLIDGETLVIFMNSSNEYTNLYDLDLIKEIHKDEGTHKLAVISYKNDERLSGICNKYLSVHGQDVPEVYTTFNYMLYGQVFGLFNSLHHDIKPDNPRPDGTVNRVVQGVTIHQYQ